MSIISIALRRRRASQRHFVDTPLKYLWMGDLCYNDIHVRSALRVYVVGIVEAMPCEVWRLDTRDVGFVWLKTVGVSPGRAGSTSI
jgi:hypothetical protein